ncbi:hypothetical protein GCK32_007787 [Trichostrongylus colubriformis]|uniref:Uncharacterized protein n=1 Tax=Trichostrongylus colubriformis TaxID=6319 RepID=A0AAN8G967_TRICO
MSFALIFFPHSRTSDVVPSPSVAQGAQTGDTTRVRWQGRNYKGKVLYTGPKEICEMKAQCVSADGELIEDVFDVSSVPADQAPRSEAQVEQSPSPSERELIMRITRIEEELSLVKNMVIQMSITLSSLAERSLRSEQMDREVLRRLPAKPAEGNIDYVYASAKEVAELRVLKESNKNHFVLAMEKLVYRDDPREMELPVDSRELTKDRVIFINRCLLKYYNVPESASEEVWRKAKDALNSRVRRLRKTVREEQAAQRAARPEDDIFDLNIYD